MEKKYEHECKVCGTVYGDNVDLRHICSDCENEYAEWLHEQGLKVGEFDDIRHPKYVAEPHKGTKWEALED